MFVSMLVVLGTAMAATYDVEVAVPSTHPDWVEPSAPYGAKRFLVQVSHADITVPSTHPAVTCAIRDGWIVVDMAADRASYPALPFTSSCSLGGDTLDIDVVAMDPSTDSALDQVVIEGNAVLIRKPYDAFTVRAFTLPECDTDYVAGTVTPSGLSGVRCRVALDTDGTWRVRVETSTNASTGTGTCVLPRVGGATMDLEVTVTEGPL